MNRIKLDLDRTLGTIDRNIFGGFVEHLGRCVYGGIYDPASPLAGRGRAAVGRQGGDRPSAPGQHPLSRAATSCRATAGATASAPSRTVRGGPSSPGHPSSRTPSAPTSSSASAGSSVRSPTSSSTAATATCARPATGSSTATGPPTRPWSGSEPATAIPDPHRVRYWGIGNEVDGPGRSAARPRPSTPGPTTSSPRSCAGRTRTSGSSRRPRPIWDGDIVERAQPLVEEAADLIDYVSIHWYVGDKDGDSAAYLATSELIEDRLAAYEGLMRGLTLGDRPARPDPARRRRVERLVPGDRRADRALGPSASRRPTTCRTRSSSAMHLNAFIRHASTVRMANLAQLVNVIAPIMTRPDGIRAPDDLPPVRAVQPDDRLRRPRRLVGRRHVQRRLDHGRPHPRRVGVARSRRSTSRRPRRQPAHERRAGRGDRARRRHLRRIRRDQHDHRAGSQGHQHLRRARTR